MLVKFKNQKSKLQFKNQKAKMVVEKTIAISVFLKQYLLNFATKKSRHYYNTAISIFFQSTSWRIENRKVYPHTITRTGFANLCLRHLSLFGVGV